MKFKTNINCGGCITKVSPFIDELAGIDSWEVDTKHRDKILKVKGSASKEAVVEAVQKAGFSIEEKKGIWGL